MSGDFHPEWLDAPEIRKLVAAFQVKSADMRFVGGAVRDALLGLPVSDVDAATPLKPEAVMKLLQEAGIKAIPTGLAHGTVTALADGRRVEITTLRKDVETFGRQARVEYTDDWKADAFRRDFTINALYLSPEGDILDYFGGIEDLKRGHVRFIGEPDARIKEDYLRILRFYRFQARFGKHAPDPHAIAACARHAACIAGLSGERIQTEMMKLLALPKASEALQPMLGPVARQVFGFDIALVMLKNLEAVEVERLLPPEAMLRLAALLLPAPKMAPVLAQAWKFSNAGHRHLQQLLALTEVLNAELSPAAQKKLLRSSGSDVFKQAVALCWAMDGRADRFKPMIALADSWTPPEFPLSGEDLKEIGMKEGKPLGDVLRALEEAWEASDYRLTREDLLKRAVA